MTRAQRAASLLADCGAHGSAIVCCGLLLWAVGQPIFTDDLWWHLALGRAFAEHGPRLAEDPLLFAPAGPPSPASWLSDVALAGLAQTTGFLGLRVLHVAFVAGILALVWSLLRRASQSAALASCGTTAFVALAAYRLVQLRPDLVSIAASLVVFHWLLADPRPPPWRYVALTSALAAFWANAHAGFPLGLVWIGAALGGLAIAAPLRTAEERRGDRARVRRLAAALAFAGLATLANPAGVKAHLAYLAAGSGTPALERIADEWVPVSLFALPASPRPPSLLAWALVWSISLATALALWRAIRPAHRACGFDPALAGVSLVALALSLSAVRFLWLGIFPILFLASRLVARGGDAPSPLGRRGAKIAAVATALLAAGFVALGDWPAITRGLPKTARGYSTPYPVNKYFAHAIWLLADSGVHGNLYHDYFLGGFAGYWLAPDVRSIVNGTLNVSSETLDALAAISARRGMRPGEPMTELLDRLGIDLFLGIRLPEAGLPGRRWIATTAHLENTPGWIPIFRNAESAIYLRANERNRANLDRLAHYYAAQHVPFDPVRGFEIEAVLRDALGWAIAHGIAPSGFASMAASAAPSSARGDLPTRHRVASLFAVLGGYDRAAAIDRHLLRLAPRDARAQRRLAWSLARIGADDEAAEIAAALAAQPEADRFSRRMAAAIREIGPLRGEERRAALAALPLLTRAERDWLTAGLVSPTARPPRL